MEPLHFSHLCADDQENLLCDVLSPIVVHYLINCFNLLVKCPYNILIHCASGETVVN